MQYFLRIASNHCPLLITTDGLHLLRALFRFEKSWTFYPRAWDLIREVWKMPIYEDTKYQVTKRLELARHKLIGGTVLRLVLSLEWRWILWSFRGGPGRGLQEFDLREL